MNAMDGTNRRSRGQESRCAQAAPASSRTTHATTMHRTRSLRMTARSHPYYKAHRAAIDQLVRDAAQRGIRSVVLCNTNIYGIAKVCIGKACGSPLLIAQARKSGTVRYVGRGANVWSNVHIDDVVDHVYRCTGQSTSELFRRKR